MSNSADISTLPPGQPHPDVIDAAPLPSCIVPILDAATHAPAWGARVTQRFGENYDLYHAKFGATYGHNGVDFSAPVGTVILATDDGEVIEIGHDGNGYGHYVKIANAWGHSIYAHLSRIDVTMHQKVRRGAAIALSGNSGFSTGPHLHFGIRVKPFDRGPERTWSNPAVALWRGRWEYHLAQRSKLTYHWMSNTRRETVESVLAARPTILKITEQIWSNETLLQELFERLPDTAFVFRNVAVSEDKNWAIGPETLADQHVVDWMQKIERWQAYPWFDPMRIAVESLNEPYIDNPEGHERVMLYNLQFMRGMGLHGVTVVAFNLGIGHPGNRGIPNGVPNWTAFQIPHYALHKQLIRWGAMFGQHLYWPAAGPTFSSDFFANSGRWMPFAGVPTFVGECGIDAVNGMNPPGFRAAGVSPDVYIAQLSDFQRLFMSKRRYIGAAVFTHGDGGDPVHWQPFDTALDDIRGKFDALAASGNIPNPGGPERFPVDESPPGDDCDDYIEALRSIIELSEKTKAIAINALNQHND